MAQSPPGEAKGADQDAMRGLIDRIRAGDVWRVVRYSAVSIAGIAFTQVLLVVLHAGLDVDATPANVVAVLIASVPVYIANRSWVWKLSGPSSVRGEIVPFWAFTLAGLVLSTSAVATVARLTDDALALNVANLVAFGALWGVKFVVLDTVVFTSDPEPEPCTEDLASILW